MAEICYFTFPTTFFALRAEAVLQGCSFAFKLVPVPRAISSSCGTALRCSSENAQEIQKILRLQGVEFEEMYTMDEKDLRRPALFSTKKEETRDV